MLLGEKNRGYREGWIIIGRKERVLNEENKGYREKRVEDAGRRLDDIGRKE